MGKKIPKQMKRRDYSGSYQNTSIDCFQLSNDESMVAIFSLIAYSFNSLVHPMSNPEKAQNLNFWRIFSASDTFSQICAGIPRHWTSIGNAHVIQPLWSHCFLQYQYLAIVDNLLWPFILSGFFRNIVNFVSKFYRRGRFKFTEIVPDSIVYIPS